MPKPKVGRGSDQFILRFPEGMRDRIARLAKKNERSMNSEILARLERTFEEDDVISGMWLKIEELEARVRDHDEQLNPGRYIRE